MLVYKVQSNNNHDDIGISICNTLVSFHHTRTSIELELVACTLRKKVTPVTMSTVYYTALTHSLSLTELEHLPRALISVNEAGIIEWVEKDVAPEEVDQVLKEHGAEGASLVRVSEGGLVPGLVDTHTVSPSLRICRPQARHVAAKLTENVARPSIS